MKKNIIKITASLFIMAAVTVSSQAGEKSVSDLQAENINALVTRSSNDLCPNGCLDNGDGCYCNGYHKTFKEATNTNEEDQTVSRN